MRRLAVLAGWVGLVALEVVVARAYVGFGTWWHWLLHQQVGWGVGWPRGASSRPCPAGGRRPSSRCSPGRSRRSCPDLQFRFARMPHEPSMDVWLGHISLHTGPVPRRRGARLAAARRLGARRRDARPAAPRGPAGRRRAGPRGVACVLARPLPATLADYPADSAPVVVR
jgi:hypothetical protein